MRCATPSFRVGIDDGKIELVFCRIEVDKKIVNFIEHGGGTCIGAVNFVEHHDRRQFRGERFLQDVARLRQRAFARVHQNEHAIHHAQRALDFAAEIAVAGRVHDINFRVVIGDRGIFRENRDSAFPLEIVRVHHARDYFLIRAENAALLEHGVNERCLAVVNMGDDSDIAYASSHSCSVCGQTEQTFSAVVQPR